MEGYTLIRLGLIGGLFFGSAYILAPTVLQEDVNSRAAARAQAAASASATNAIDLTVAYRTTGDTEALAAALDARLSAADVGVSRVVADRDEVVVTMQPGTLREDVTAWTTSAGNLALHDPASLTDGELPDAQAAAAKALGATLERAIPAGLAHALSLGGQAVPAGLPAVDVALSNVSELDGTWTGSLAAPLPDGLDTVVVSVDGTATFGLLPTEGAAQLIPLTGADVSTVVANTTHPLPGELVEIDETKEAVVQDEAAVETEAEESSVPDWVLGMLPDTRINLGLDLQGGVDLTLQVGLEEAIQGQVSRDATRLRESAKRNGFEFRGIRPDLSLPLIWIDTDADLETLRDYVLEQLGSEYVYSTTEGTRHGFEMAETRQSDVQAQAVDQVLETLRKRVDATGVKEPSIVRKGGGRINVQLPGEVDVEAAVDAIGTTAVLEFRMVDEDFDDAVLDRIITEADKQMPPEQYLNDAFLNHWLWRKQLLPEDRIVLWQYSEERGPEGEIIRERTVPVVFRNEVILTGADVNSAGVGFDSTQRAAVSMDFKPRGGRIFCEVTGEAVGKRFGIILDGVVESAPVINEQICGGSAQIRMGDSIDPMKDANTLALVLRTGSLDAPVDVGGVSSVGASLGTDSIRAGSIAALIGGAVVLVFMGLWYRRSGLIANVALMLNVMMVLAALGLFGATLTLPGIAGIALTIGMAVDANIIIYERIREERKLGIAPRKAVDVGFEKALWAVLDANITTAIAGIVLYSYGTGPIKGFAVTLLVGIVTTLITALFVTRTLMELSTRSSSAKLRI